MGDKRPLTSAVWSYFIRNVDSTAQCTFCQSQMKCKGSSTSGLLRHLQNIHGIELQPINQQTVKQEAGPSHKRSRNDDQYNSNKKNIENSNFGNNDIHGTSKNSSEILARLIVQDNISIDTMINSYYLNYFLLQNGIQIPKDVNDIWNLILNFNTECKFKISEEIQQLLKSNYKFSLSIEVVSNLKNQKFLKISIYDIKNSKYCLGLIYCSTKWDNKEIADIVKNHLNKFNISLENHIVAISTNDQKVKKIFEENTLIESLLCLNDAIHEAILEVIFPNNAENQTDSSDSETYISSNYQNKSSDDDNSGSSSDFNAIVAKVRRITKLYEDPMNNSNLQNFVRLELGSELRLIQDLKTCWNSTTLMIERFLELKECVHNSLIDINKKYLWDEIDIQRLESFLLILRSIKIAVEALNQQDTTIPSADVILNTLLRKLQNMDTHLAKEMYTSLKNKINERRKEKLYCLVKYLKYPDSILSSRKNDEADICSKSNIIAYAEKIFNRLFVFPKSEIYYSSEFDDEIYNDDVKPPIKCCINIDLEKEFQLFEDTGKRSEHLDLLYNALLTIKLTVSSNTKVFSSFRSKKREIENKLPPEIASAFVCLKEYFDRNKIEPALARTFGK